ncbi:hypothetical protein MRX96_034293 [Rhipicephalus microplus]
MTLTVPEDGVEEVLDFLKNTILDAMSAENTRQSTRSSSGRPTEDDALERRVAAAFRTAAFQEAGLDEPEDAVTPLSVVALMRLIEDELLTDAATLYTARGENDSDYLAHHIYGEQGPSVDTMLTSGHRLLVIILAKGRRKHNSSGINKPPNAFSFSSPNEWTERKRFRTSSGLCVKPEQHQVDALLYIMSEQAEKIYATFALIEENSKKFDAVVEQSNDYFNSATQSNLSTSHIQCHAATRCTIAKPVAKAGLDHGSRLGQESGLDHTAQRTLF